MAQVAPRETAGITTRLILAYIRRHHGDEGVRQLLELAGETRSAAELSDERTWSSYEQKIALFEAAEQLTGDEQVARHIGESLLDEQIGSALRVLIGALGSPQQVLRSVARANSKFSTNSTMQALSARPGRAVVTYRVDEGYTPSRHDCLYTQGIITQATVLFGLPKATIAHPRCQVEGAEVCRYEVTWPLRARLWTRVKGRVRSSDRAPEMLALRQQVADLHRTVADLVSVADLDDLLARIAGRASGAVRGQRYLLAVHLTGEDRPRIHSDGLTTEQAQDLGASLLAGGQGRLDGAEHLVAEVASAHRRYGWLATYLPGGKGGFLPGEHDQLAAYSRLAAAALDSATALAEARRQQGVAEALLRLARELAHLEDARSIADRVTEAAPIVVGASRSLLLRWDEPRQRLVALAAHGQGELHEAAMALELARGWSPLLDRLLDDHEPQVATRPGPDPGIQQVMEHFDIHVVAAAPVISRGRLLGAVLVSWADGASAPGDDHSLVWALEGLADQASVALANVELLDAARYQARHDPLTGLANRLLLQEHLSQSTADLNRTGLPFAVCFLDLDHFKDINDEHGHAAGDAVLIEVARRLRARVRETDAIARVSGDEFVILVRHLDGVAGAKQVAADIVEELGRPYELAAGRVRLGVSIGVALAPDHGTQADDLLRAADEAMYAAKRERGTYRVADDARLGAPTAPSEGSDTD